MRKPPPGFRFQRKDTEQYHVCLGAPGISRRDERRFAASMLDAILGGSASSRLFQEIREKRGMAYSVYSFASQYSDIGPDRPLRRHARGEPRRVPRDRRCASSRDVAAGNVRPGELERAKENLKGRMLLSIESTSNRMSRLGKSLITDTELLALDEIVAGVEAVEADAVAALAADLLPPERLSAAGIGPDRGRFLAAVERVNPALGGAPRHEVLLYGRGGRVGSVLGPALEAAGHELVETSRRRRGGDRLHPAGGGRGERSRALEAAFRWCRHQRLRPGAVDALARGRAAGVLRTELRARSGADDALRGRGGALLPHAEIVELHHDTKLDAPSGTAKATAALLPPPPRSTPSGCRGSSPTRK